MKPPHSVYVVSLCYVVHVHDLEIGVWCAMSASKIQWSVFLGKTIPTDNTNIIIQAINKRDNSIGHYNVLARIGLFSKKSC